MKTFKHILTGLVLVAGIVLGITFCGKAPKTEPYFLNHSDTVDYVGIDKCRVCHSEHYATFIHTGMGQSFGEATRDRSKAITTSKPVYDPNRDMYYLAAWEGEKLKITEYRLRGKDTVHKRSEYISHIVGSGQHTNSHMWQDNGFLYQAPLTWYAQQGKWDLPPGYQTTNTGFSRKIDIECMSCHNAMPAVQQGSINKFTRLPSGIDCERCHGPGELHVNLKSSGVLVDVSKEADRSIVNPARLPWKLQVDICQRCHLQGNNVLKPGKSFTDFRPGMKLSDVFDVFMPAATDEFFMAGHAERLQMSACFKASNQGDLEKYNPRVNFTCITCHNPHVSVKATNIQRFNNACINCHKNNGASKLAECSESEITREKQGNNCVACHMPSSGTEDIPHVTVHDHYIRKDYKNIQATSGKSDRLYAVNDPKPDSQTETEGYISWFEKFDPNKNYLKVAESQIKKSPPNTETLIHFYYANSDWAAITNAAAKLNAESADAWTCYRCGKAFDRLNEPDKSISWYRAAANKMPLYAGFVAEYGNALIRLGRNAEALELLEPAVKQQPKEVLLLINTGLAKLNTGSLAEGKTLLLRAVALDPEQYNAWTYLLQLYEKVQDKEGIARCKVNMRRINPTFGAD